MIGILFTYAKKGIAEDTVNDLKKKPVEQIEDVIIINKKKI
jgi:hypothetical protein